MAEKLGPLNTGDFKDSGAFGYPDAANLSVYPNYELPEKAVSYRPNKRERNIRKQVYMRYYQMRDNDWRTEAERDWQHADQEYRMFVPGYDLGPASTNTDWLSHPDRLQIPDPDDKRSRIRLPDSFASIQSHMAENLDRRSRPKLKGTEESDEPVEDFANTVMKYNMDNTGFDYQWYLAGLTSAIRGTAFIYDYYRVDKRWVKDIDSVDDDGKIVYKDREVVDFDDDYAKWLPNEYCYVDEKCNHIDDAVDAVRREIYNIREFQRTYAMKKDFKNIDRVRRGGDLSTRSYFKLPKDITENDVEVIHYYNRALDVYWVCANYVVIRDGPLPWKHKEIPFAVRYYYRVPGQFWGMGIPKVLMMLSEERNSIRNLNIDRQNLQINKMFIANNAFDLMEEDLVSRPNGLIRVDAPPGTNVKDALVPLEYGDVSPSYFKTEQIMVEDMIRATGIDTRLTDVPQQNTATASAISKEQQLKRVTMLSTLDEIDTLIRLGRLKWSNIQFFYPLGRMDTISEDNEERQEQVFKKITSHGRRFRIVNENGQKVLKMEDVTGASSFMLDKKMSKYLEGSFDIYVDGESSPPVSRAIQQTKVTELASLIAGNPLLMAQMDPGKMASRLLTVNDERPEDWTAGFDQDPGHTMLEAETENRVMAAGQPLSPTPGATQAHTLVHLMYTQSVEYQAAPPHIKELFMQHIMGEHDQNPATGSAEQAMNQNGLQPTPPSFIGQLPNLPSLGLTSRPETPGQQPGGLTKPTRTGV